MSLFERNQQYHLNPVNVENSHIKIIGLSPNNKYLIISYWKVFSISTILILNLETEEQYYNNRLNYDRVISYFHDDDIYLVSSIINNNVLISNVEKVSFIPNTNNFTTTRVFYKYLPQSYFENIDSLGTIVNLIISPNNKFIVIQYDYFNKGLTVIPQLYILYIDEARFYEIGHINVASVYKNFFRNSDFSFLYNFNNSITFSNNGQYLYFIPGTKIRIDFNKILNREITIVNKKELRTINIQQFITYRLSSNLINRNIIPNDPEIVGYIMDIGKPNIHVNDYIGLIYSSDNLDYNNNIIIYSTSNNTEIIRHHIDSNNSPEEMKILPGKLGNIGATHYIINALSRARGGSKKAATDIPATASASASGTSRRRYYSKRHRTRKYNYKSKPSDVLHDTDAIEMLNEFEEDGKIAILMNNQNILIYSGTTNNELLQTLDEFEHKSMIFSNDGKVCFAYCINPHIIIKYVYT